MAILVSNAHAELTEQQRAVHVLNRLAYGPRPGDIASVMNLGVSRYIDAQLAPDSIPLPAEYQQRLDALTAQTVPTEDLIQALRPDKQADAEARKQQRTELIKQVAEHDAQLRLVQALYSPRQLQEVMVDFWFNHFNVFANKGLDRVLVEDYERNAIRPYALGHFRDLLGATAKHPAMLFYLDNWQSVAAGTERNKAFAKAAKSSGLNENYARELMELHTLGVDGGYTQQDVTELARMLTGWTFYPRNLGQRDDGFQFNARVHDNGDKQWLGYHVAAQGEREGEFALDVLAASPATAKHISYELAQYFVSDTPPPALVDRLARRFVDTHGDIQQVLRSLFDSREFWDVSNVGSKFKTPYQYVLSALRATGDEVSNVRPIMATLSQQGMPLYGCQTPNGYKNTADAWANPEAITQRINFATALATGRLPLNREPDMGNAAPITEVDVYDLLSTLGVSISAQTRATVMSSATGRLRAAMVLGSPDFMQH
jgi:uncharacterized protein (DUF1800 family)